MAILIPSGILWKLIASAKDSPNPLLVELERNVATPSGILCIIIASIETRPNLYSFLLLILLLSLVGKNLSINIDTITPIEINIKSPKKDLKKKPKPINDDGKAKKKRKKVFRTIKVLLLIGVILGGTIYFLLSPIFNITEINVSGNSKISSEEIISLSGIQKNENTFKINKKTVKDKIRENPYIDTISIKRTLPDSITIYVTERVATYRINKANTYMLINNQGYMLEITDEENNLPIITGLQTTDEEIQEGNRLRVEDLEKLEDVLKISESAKTNELYSLITEIDISEKDNYKLVIPSEKKIIHLGDTSKLPVKMGYIISIMEKEKDEGEILVNTDLENEGAIIRKKV